MGITHGLPCGNRPATTAGKNPRGNTALKCAQLSSRILHFFTKYPIPDLKSISELESIFDSLPFSLLIYVSREDVSVRQSYFA